MSNLRHHELFKGSGNVLVVMLHIHPGSVDGHGLDLLLRQQLPADLLPLLGHLQMRLCLLQMVPKLALVVGQGLQEGAGGTV